MTIKYSDLDAELTLRIFKQMPPRAPDPFEDAQWFIPGVGVGHYEDALIWYDEQTKLNCPYYIASTGGPKDLPGAYGPGTCGGGCWEEPRCMT